MPQINPINWLVIILFISIYIINIIASFNENQSNLNISNSLNNSNNPNNW